jgi:hypothetical protein
MIAAYQLHGVGLADLAAKAHELCLRHAQDARRIVACLRSDPARSKKVDAAAWVEGSLREYLHDSAVDGDVYALAHEEDREVVQSAVEQGYRQARTELNGTLDESTWEGLKNAVYYRLVW